MGNKKRTGGLALVAGLMALAIVGACDKIDSDQYTVYDGAAVSWVPGSAVASPVQRVLVEKFTGPHCNNCPLADSTLATLGADNIVIISINHPTGQGLPFPGDPDLRTPGGTAWDQWYGINAIPSAFIDRKRDQQFTGRMATIGSAIAASLGQAPTIGLEVSAQKSAGREVDITVGLTFVQDYGKAVALTAALVEDSMAYRQILPNGAVQDDYRHNHMLRKVITGYWGREVDSKGTAGESLRGTLRFTPDDDVELGNAHIVVFVSDKASRRVLNSASCRIDTYDAQQP